MTEMNHCKVLAVALATSLLALMEPAGASSPGENGKIAFVGFPSPPGSSEIYVMNSDGSGKKNLTRSPAGEGDPAWSPDGKKIAFVRGASSDIWVMNSDGSGKEKITKTPAAYEGNPTWSPDGTKIAFHGRRNELSNNNEIYVKRLSGAKAKNLTLNPANDRDPAWSPNGKWIAFTSDRDGNFNNEIYRMRADGRGPINLTNNPTSSLEGHPDWSPDSKNIVYWRFEGEGSPQENGEIFRMGFDGTNPTNLTNDPAEDYDPVYSPNGKSIAFTSGRDGDKEVFRMGSGGLNAANLTNNTKLDISASWQPLLGR